MSADIGNIEVYMGPPEVGGPDDLEATIVGFIGGARDELAVAVQELESESVTRALIDARRQGVKVRVILERIYLGLDVPPLDPFVAGGANDENRRLFAALLRAGIEVTIDLNPQTFHQKFIVRDPDGPSARRSCAHRINELHADRAPCQSQPSRDRARQAHGRRVLRGVRGDVDRDLRSAPRAS